MDLSPMNQFFEVFPWWSPAALVAAFLVVRSFRGNTRMAQRTEIPEKPLLQSTTDRVAADRDTGQGATGGSKAADEESTRPTAQLHYVEVTQQGTRSRTEEKAKRGASTPSTPDVHYIEVSHWWETDDENVLIALGVDGAIHRLAKVDGGKFDLNGGDDGTFWKKLGAAINGEASSVRFKGTDVSLDIKKKGSTPELNGFDLGNGMVAVPAREGQGTARANAGELKSNSLSDVDLLRVRLWRARASHSRQAGLALVILSAALFVGAFVTANLVLQIASVSSFVIGISLVAYEAEPRVKLFPSMSSLIGPLKVVERELEQRGLSASSAVFVSSGAGDSMDFAGTTSDGRPSVYSTLPLGDGLVHAYELEIGDLPGMGMEGARVWLPRVMVEGLGLAESIEMKVSENEVTTSMVKPFVRVLCVQDFMSAGLCKSSGCPLAASVGQSLAKASGKPVTHRGCTYDPVTQKAVLKDTIA